MFKMCLTYSTALSTKAWSKSIKTLSNTEVNVISRFPQDWGVCDIPAVFGEQGGGGALAVSGRDSDHGAEQPVLPDGRPAGGLPAHTSPHAGHGPTPHRQNKGAICSLMYAGF